MRRVPAGWLLATLLPLFFGSAGVSEAAAASSTREAIGKKPMLPQEISLNGADWRVLPMMPGEWEWKRVWEHPDQVYRSLWIPAQVPGAVQDDAHDAGLTPDFTRDFDSRACEWTSERDWIYLKEFDTPALPAGEIARLRFEGVDYACHVYLNGKHLGDHAGMYDAFEYDVTPHLVAEGKNRLVVVVEHAPREVGQIGRTTRVKIWKARFAYDWDWCVRLVPIGIWDGVRLLVTGPAYLRDVHVTAEPSDDYRTARVGITITSVLRLMVMLTLAVRPLGKVTSSGIWMLMAIG